MSVGLAATAMILASALASALVVWEVASRWDSFFIF